LILYEHDIACSGVTWVPCALGTRKILAPPSTKTAEFVNYVLLIIKICIQYCDCSPSQFCGIKEPPLSLSCIKTAEFGVKNRHKSAEEAKAEHLLELF